MHENSAWEPIEGLPGAFLVQDFFSEDKESLLTEWAEGPELDWSEEGQRRLIHHGDAYNPGLKLVTVWTEALRTLLRQ